MNTLDVSRSRLPREWVLILCAALLPFIFTTMWLMSNTQLPPSDATDYISSAVLSYRHLTDNGLLHGIAHFEIVRGWRPIFFSVLGLPFLIISHGNAFFAYHGVIIACILASAAYVYLLLKLKLDHLSAIIATNLICLLPFIQSPLLTFFAESALFPSILATIYHLIQSDYLRRKWHTYAFVGFLSLAIVVRPVEAVTHVFIMLSLFLGLGWYKRVFSLKQVVTVFAWAMSSVFLFLFVTMTHFIDHYPSHIIDGGMYDLKLAKVLYHLLILSFASIVGLWGSLALIQTQKLPVHWLEFINRREANSPVVKTFCSIMGLVLVWFLPYAFSTFLWVYRTSIGDIAYGPSLPIGLPFWSGLSSFIHSESTLVVYGGIILGTLGVLSVSWFKTKQLLSSTLFLYVAALIPFPLWEVFFTVQSSTRKLSIAFPALLMLLMLIGLQAGRLQAFRIFVAVEILIAQFAAAICFLFPNAPTTFLNFAGVYPRPVIAQPNPHAEVLKFISEQAKQYQFKKLEIEVNVERQLPIDTFLFKTLALIAKEQFEVHYPYFSTYNPNAIQQLSTQSDALFLSDKLSNMQVSKVAAKAYEDKYQAELNPTLKTLDEFLMHYARGDLKDKGWTVGPCTTIKAANKEDYLGCLLFAKKETTKPDVKPSVKPVAKPKMKTNIQTKVKDDDEEEE